MEKPAVHVVVHRVKDLRVQMEKSIVGIVTTKNGVLILQATDSNVVCKAKRCICSCLNI